ncbi:hypothetical protein [Vibrio aerogenes]|nr:hypothetical protein [Vibrio aerogenes]
MNYSYKAQVGIRIDKGIDEECFSGVAASLSNIFDEFYFEQDHSDRYDDFLAVYIAKFKNIEFMLIGPPLDYEDYDLDEEPDYCQLNFVFRVKGDLEIANEYKSDFISKLLQDKKNIASEKRIDVSNEMVRFINNSGGNIEAILFE